ncbi:hypothetical protein FGO68_gene4715 [Halteria grandinella]|uniref:D-glutamate cyclase-like C-terminal domain-containing protein n=1 Tax=Halteria grandinella TaxID=5974 RepID=A0A8J8T153_HALGN|nr:hypothetical protein FGO68_gene4715 [Halteria grandinella]
MVEQAQDSKSLKAIQEMVAIVQTDIGKRGIKHIFPEDNPKSFQDAALALLKAQKVAILTGFQCLVDSDPHIETDGIAGALVIARALAVLGRHSTILMDSHCETIMKDIIANYFIPELLPFVDLKCFTCGKGTLTPEELHQLQTLSKECDAIVSIERPSVNPTGSYMTMRAIDIIDLTSEFDQHLFPQVGKPKFNPNQALISIGDGGNEVGMGRVIELVQKHITNGEKICANTVCDSLLVSDTSNFGGYALVNAMLIELFSLYKIDQVTFSGLLPPPLANLLESLQNDTSVKDFLHMHLGVTLTQEKLCADLCIKHGIKDGITKRVENTVDGLAFDVIVDIIEGMQKVVDGYDGQ